MMKRQFNRMRQQLSHPNITSRAQEATELLPEDLLQIEQRIEPAKRAAHSVSKRLQACLQGQCGSEMDKRVKKLPLMALSTTMAESFKELDTESSLGKALEMGCCIQSSLAKILAEFEIALEHDVLQPLNKLSEEELPIILKRKKTLQKLISDWNTIKSRLNQAAKSSSNSTGTGVGPGASSAANKLEILKEEEEEVKRKVEQCKVRTSLALHPWGSSRAGDLFLSSGSIQGDHCTKTDAASQHVPQANQSLKETPYAQGKRRVKDSKHKLLQRGGSRDWSRELMGFPWARSQLSWLGSMLGGRGPSHQFAPPLFLWKALRLVWQSPWDHCSWRFSTCARILIIGHYSNGVAEQGGIPTWPQSVPLGPNLTTAPLSGQLTAQVKVLCEGVPSSLGAREEGEGCFSLHLPSQDEYMADLYHFSTKEDSYASYFIRLLEIQAQYHRQSLGSLDSALAELKESHSQTEPSFTADTPVAGYYGVPLETHLKSLNREIALPIEACVMMLLASGMREEGLFRLAAGASVLRKLKSSLASGSNALEEFYSDPHAVAGALKSYLRELPQPLMTSELYDEWVKVGSLKDIDDRVQSLQDTCSRLPRDSYNNLRYLIKFLAKLAEHQEVNKMTPSNIAIVLGPNLLWPQQNTEDPVQLDLASVSSIQVVGVVEALIQNADTLFPGEVDFNVSGMFTPPANSELRKATPVEDPSPEPPPASTPALTDGEATSRDPEARSQPASPPVTRPPSEATAPPASQTTEDTARKGKRPAPARPTMPPPPVAQPRSTAPAPAAPEHTTSPKARPRRTAGAPSRAPSVPPPLPPQPAPRHSRDAPPSPRPPAGEAEAAAAMDCALGATDEGQPLAGGGRSPTATSPPAQPTEN
ncbi:PREDICTED: SH3 domain-binding protein 1 isoform X1 [Calidris pugnax]|uniref:SH3 domain-binding protein 1 isoform X1 n=1 Tax=Calidris pugnax TaxID=198806 RepID=UPI00071CAA24|nr:PREDICTED: SH3 domain-binding protein 1 isoform X1 [Calidris pugnax]